MSLVISPSPGPVLLPGDAIFFWGKGILSDGIMVLTHGPSHVATVLDPDLPLPDGSKQKELHVIESTILNGVDGVQINTLASRVNHYDEGGCVAGATLSGFIRSFIDWKAVWEKARSCLGHHYNKLEIGAYVINLLVPPELGINRPDGSEEVCSEFRAELLRAGGIPGLHPFLTPPAVLWRMRMYGSVFPYVGKIPTEDLRNFNTV